MPPKIDYAKCDACGICIFQCGKDVFKLEPTQHKVYPVNPKDCVHCFICEDRCPNKAILITLLARSNN